MQEAMELEHRAFLQDRERQNRLEEKKKRLGKPIKGEVLTRQEREARIWAFMYLFLSLHKVNIILRHFAQESEADRV